MSKTLTKADKAQKLKELISSLYNKELEIRTRKAEVEAAVGAFNKLRFPKNYSVDDLICSIANQNKGFWFLLGDMSLSDFSYKLFSKQLAAADRELLDYMFSERRKLTKRARELLDDIAYQANIER